MGGEGQLIEANGSESRSAPVGNPSDEPLTPLDPAHIKLLRVRAAISSGIFLAAALAAEATGVLPRGVVFLPVLAIAAWYVIRMPLRRHQARGYSFGADRLRVVRGVWFRSDTVVPFGRVQHIDMIEGALERGYGLATLVLHTAGTHNASVALPGLARADAVAMRETIGAHIRHETR
jgi:uncharacterized protein